MADKQMKLPKNFVDPRDRLVLNEVPLIDVSELPRAPITPLDEERHRKSVVAVDEVFLTPFLADLAAQLGVDVIDDDFYTEIMPTTDKASSISIVQCRHNFQHYPDKGYSEWEGLQVIVCGFLAAGALVRAYVDPIEGAFMHVRLWDRRKENYLYHGDPEGKRRLRPEAVMQIVLNFLDQEGIITPLVIRP